MFVMFETLCDQSGGAPFYLEGYITDYAGHYLPEGGGYIVFCGGVRFERGSPMGGWGSGIFLSIFGCVTVDFTIYESICNICV